MDVQGKHVPATPDCRTNMTEKKIDLMNSFLKHALQTLHVTSRFIQQVWPITHMAHMIHKQPKHFLQTRIPFCSVLFCSELLQVLADRQLSL